MINHEDPPQCENLRDFTVNKMYSHRMPKFWATPRSITLLIYFSTSWNRHQCNQQNPTLYELSFPTLKLSSLIYLPITII